jgi:hypothetical protein
MNAQYAAKQINKAVEYAKEFANDCGPLAKVNDTYHPVEKAEVNDVNTVAVQVMYDDNPTIIILFISEVQQLLIDFAEQVCDTVEEIQQWAGL